MNNLSEIFDIENFNVLDDDNYYYFFRALNNADNKQIEEKSITDYNGNVIKVNTDLSRFEGDAKYSDNLSMSLEEMIDHIKMHYRKDTKCISLSSNANVSLTYGRGYYKDNYIIVKVKKSNLGKIVYNAPLYMIREISKRIDEIIKKENIDTHLIDKINNAKTLQELSIYEEPEQLDEYSKFEEGIKFVKTIQASAYYQTLDDEQNLEKNKLVAKINLISENVIPNMSNRFLMQTIGNALSSMELIHYDTINKDEIINIPKEIVDVLSVIQQLPKDSTLVKRLKKEVIDCINRGSFSTINSFNYENKAIDSDLSIEETYNLTNGKVPYTNINTLYYKAFYIAKSKLRCKNALKNLNEITLNDTDYLGLENYIKDNCFGIEPEIILRQNNRGFKISESVNLDINSKEYNVLDAVANLSDERLEDIINNPAILINYLMNRLEQRSLSKEDYYASAILDLFDFKKMGIESLDIEKRNDIIKKLKEKGIISVYNKLKSIGIKEKDISNALLTCIIKNKDINNIDINDTFTVSELEDFVGYYRIKGTSLKLRDYQAIALKNVDKKLKKHRFTSAVMPTGSGKSYVALSKMLDYKDKKIIYLAPNDEILNQMRRLIRDTLYGKDMRKSLDNIVKEVFPNLKLATYQSLLSENNEFIKDKYDFVVFDEMHRTGATIWNEKVNILINNQDDNTKYLGITATPQRDADLVNMADELARKFGYSEEEIKNDDHIAYKLDLIDAIKAGYVMNPKIVQCEYNLLHDGSLEKLLEKINQITDIDKRNYHLSKLEVLKRNLSNAVGISDIIGNNIKDGGRYIVFLPINRKDNRTYEDEDGNIISNSKAEHIIKIYKNMMNQYMFTYMYVKENENILNSIYNKITNNISLSSEELSWINNEKENILLLSKIRTKAIKNEDSITTKENDIAESIIKYMNFKKLDETKKGALLSKKTKDYVENYSMLGSYGSKHNDKELMTFEHDDFNKYKFMLVMNKLNEGTHIKGVNGLIWFRALDENSKILFLQQFGRIIFGLDPNKDYSDEERTVAIDLVNNTLRVNIQKGEKKYQDDIELLKNIIEWCKVHNNLLPDINSKDRLESRYASILKSIQNKYDKYIDSSRLDELPNDDKDRILTILNLGSEIGLWNAMFDDRISQTEKGFNYIESDDSLFELTSVLKDFVNIENNIDKEINNTIEKTLKEIKKYLEEHPGITNYRNIQDRLQTADGKIGLYLMNIKEKIKELSNENNDAKYICDYFKWNITMKEILKEIRKYLEERPGITYCRKIFDILQTTGGNMGHYLHNNKEKIKELSNENSDAEYICEYFNWLEAKEKVTMEEILKEIRKYLEEHPKIASYGRIQDRLQTTGSKIGKYLNNNKEKIKETSSENSDAKYICEYFNWLKKKEEILKEIREYLEKHPGITSYAIIQDRLQTTGSKIGNYLIHKKTKIKELSNENSDAKYICEYFNWLEEKVTMEEILKEIRKYLEEHPYITNFNTIQDRLQITSSKIGRYLSRNKEKIKETSSENSDAKYICEYFNWLKKKEEILKEIREYLEKHPGITSYTIIPDKLQTTGGKIGWYLFHNKEKIKILSNEKNDDAKYICNYFKWFEEKAIIEDILKEIKEYLEEHPGITSSRKIQDRLQTTGGKIGNYLSFNNKRIKELSNENSDAKYICEYFNWVSYSDSEPNPLDDKYKNIDENHYNIK